MRILPVGDAALLVELGDLAQALALYRVLQERPPAGITELVPAARTVLVRYRPELIPADALGAQLLDQGAALDTRARAPDGGRLVEIPVHYNGADLPELAELLGLTVPELVARHTAQPWQAAFAGFAPGFIYLAGGALGQPVPRRKVPRTRVPAGSVALAGELSAVYPSDSPGGWQLIGVTDVAMWDLQRAEPAWVQPGFRVQFVDVGAARRHVSLPEARKSVPLPAPAASATEPAITIVRAGLQTLAQDRGRPGRTALGISASGALDAGAMARANRLVGNPPDAPILENLLGRMLLRSHGRSTLALAGARVPLQLRAADGGQWPISGERAIALDDGDALLLGAVQAGLRCTLAVRGGWQVEPVLGSCSTDTLARLGPSAISDGTRLAVGQAVPPQRLRAVATALPPAPALPHAGGTVTLDVALGPRSDWFTPDALALLQEQAWTVTPQSDRIGIRLQGELALTRRRHDELPSEGTVSGAVQVPASGQPLVFLADHPLTIGYPVIAVVMRHHLDLAAQIPVDCRVRFNVVAPFFETSHA